MWRKGWRLGLSHCHADRNDRTEPLSLVRTSSVSILGPPRSTSSKRALRRCPQDGELFLAKLQAGGRGSPPLRRCAIRRCSSQDCLRFQVPVPRRCLHLSDPDRPLHQHSSSLQLPP
ncbi:hypothetical protein O181_039055 [Austropuccinia psidii MF-1]|uniref:Uncharacterized protein n=1 Tax=Austropuccinia psidii MF-1 TaxID=1389203 RepID=A0A9Q3DE48_9BASI|nr:hypothetical protein [Austropuccinia psidii MF-1]